MKQVETSEQQVPVEDDSSILSDFSSSSSSLLLNSTNNSDTFTACLSNNSSLDDDTTSEPLGGNTTTIKMNVVEFINNNNHNYPPRRHLVFEQSSDASVQGDIVSKLINKHLNPDISSVASANQSTLLAQGASLVDLNEKTQRLFRYCRLLAQQKVRAQIQHNLSQVLKSTTAQLKQDQTALGNELNTIRSAAKQFETDVEQFQQQKQQSTASMTAMSGSFVQPVLPPAEKIDHLSAQHQLYTTHILPYRVQFNVDNSRDTVAFLFSNGGVSYRLMVKKQSINASRILSASFQRVGEVKSDQGADQWWDVTFDASLINEKAQKMEKMDQVCPLLDSIVLKMVNAQQLSKLFQ
eukprot:CAMPEP_0201561972 /NCGR_PEP_ID=MMETSP0173_2-20130828/79078_1 /ASSEMBLY_ACC=CAM_ASM_000268 /TAXON_ID=218659 /ORGANISM="Vexillifera sp., Strain DIVA3 564/2" /LENGTH=351 /DNA_ID=CAMNT_0047976503 /DNA_START=645 /DNA_END=1700 /DNA_ORIENTATION=-